ncbi:MAG TPA: bifunctional rhamnulose-1-phosphate aldolase/short-chain dehydrogenase [Dehalococcoidia bacterium]|nr:bifunctional rhamnulose-1-phosphate aldolase/short-chain dehydrogenase [Dehalococcoidia bacterium]
MNSRWSDGDAAGLNELELLVYLSRLVGDDSSLVVWGGGNTSVKVEEKDFRGRPTAVLRVKGSGSDLKAVGASDFTGVRMDDVLPLEERGEMTDEEMVDYLARTIMDPGSPRPSIETLLHAFVPARWVLHSHADAVVALSNTGNGAEILRQALGPGAIPVQYRRPGFVLSKEVAEAARAGGVESVVLMNHGLVSWGETARETYEQHLTIVSRAEDYARQERGSRRVFGPAAVAHIPMEERRLSAAAIAPALRGALGRNQQTILRYDDGDDVLEFVCSERAAALSQIGPATPDHLLNTKRLPLFVSVPDPTDPTALSSAIERGLAEYEQRYLSFVAHNNRNGVPALAAVPRVVLVPGLGMWTCGRDSRAAMISGDIYHHTIGVMASSESVGSYRSLEERDAYEAEYWPLELYKLTLQPPERLLERRVALVTGAASGIGRAIARRFASEGAHVVVADIDTSGAAKVAQEISSSSGEGRALGITLDVTSEDQVRAAFQGTALAYGGVDIIVSNAGIAPSAALADIALADWDRSLAVNATGHFLISREAIRMLRRQGTGGNVIFITSKNVPAPGAEFGAYSAAKAAEAQLARIVAIEGGPDGIRANMINPDAVFEGSGLFDQDLRARRAAAHGVAPDQLEEFYRQRNLLKARVFADDVAEGALFLASSQSSKTTGAMLPVDGGVREAFPR